MYVVLGEHRFKARYREDFIDGMIGVARDFLGSKPGCLRYDVFRDIDEPDCLRVCEVFTSKDAYQAAHAGSFLRQTLPAKWTSRRVKNVRCHNVFPGEAGMKTAPGALSVARRKDERYVHLGVWHIKPEYRDAYVKAMSINARASIRNEPGCYRFDILQGEDNPDRFYLYQIYVDRKTHDLSHDFKPWVDKLKSHPAWSRWSVRNSRPPFGRISATGFSNTVCGTVIWSHDAWKKRRAP